MWCVIRGSTRHIFKLFFKCSSDTLYEGICTVIIIVLESLIFACIQVLFIYTHIHLQTHTLVYIAHLRVHLKYIKVYERVSFIHRKVQPITQENIHYRYACIYIYIYRSTFVWGKKVRIKETIHTLTGINQNIHLSKDS